MRFLQKHAKSICFIILSIPLCITFSVFCENYSDYTYFIDFILSLSIVVLTGLKLFNRIGTETFISLISCNGALIIASNKLYSYDKLMRIKDSFRFSNPYVSLAGIVFLAIFVLLTMKLILWAKIKDTESMGQRENSIQRSEENNTISENNVSVNSDISPHTSAREKNTVGYIIAVTGLVIFGLVFSVIIIYFIHKNFSNDSWKENLKLIFLCVVVAIGFLFALYLLVIAAKSIIDIVRYKKNNNDLLQKISEYRLSVLITIALFCILYFFKGEFVSDDLTNLISSGIGDILAIPIAFCILLSAFFVVVYIIHIILKVFSVDDNKIPYEEVKTIGKEVFGKVYKIVKKLYKIVIDSIESALDFARFIPDYFDTIQSLVLGDDDDDDSQETETSENVDRGGENENT